MQIQSQSLWANRQMSPPPKLSQDQLKADASAVFQKLDSQQKGFLEQADFSAALSQLQQSADDDQSAAWFSQLDADQDGKLTSDEFSTAVSEQLYNAQGKFGMQGSASPTMPQGMPPMGPPPGEDGGKTVDELTAMVEELSATDSKAAAGLQSIIDQFDSADQNKDGKVTMQEAQALKQQQDTGSSSTMTADSGQLKLQQTLMQLMKTYGATAGQSAENNTLSYSI